MTSWASNTLYWVLLGFTRFYWVLLGFTGFSIVDLVFVSLFLFKNRNETKNKNPIDFENASGRRKALKCAPPIMSVMTMIINDDRDYLDFDNPKKKTKNYKKNKIFFLNEKKKRAPGGFVGRPRSTHQKKNVERKKYLKIKKKKRLPPRSKRENLKLTTTTTATRKTRDENWPTRKTKEKRSTESFYFSFFLVQL